MLCHYTDDHHITLTLAMPNYLNGISQLPFYRLTDFSQNEAACIFTYPEIINAKNIVLLVKFNKYLTNISYLQRITPILVGCLNSTTFNAQKTLAFFKKKIFPTKAKKINFCNC